MLPVVTVDVFNVLVWIGLCSVGAAGFAGFVWLLIKGIEGRMRDM